MLIIFGSIYISKEEFSFINFQESKFSPDLMQHVGVTVRFSASNFTTDMFKIIKTATSQKFH